MSIYEEMLATGTTIDHHESDMYVGVNENTKKIVDGYRFKSIVTTFTCNVTGKEWYDIPFAYAPYWDKRAGK